MRDGIETLPETSPIRSLLLLAAALGVGTVGILLLVDRPGLAVEYFATTTDWQGPPVYSDVGAPQVTESGEVAGILVSTEIFSLRWRGWLWIDRTGEYRFSLKADERAYLKLDGELALQSDRVRKERAQLTRRILERGFHPIEAGLVQTGGNCRMNLRWSRADGHGRRLSGDPLYVRSPLGIYRLLRQWTGPLSLLQRRLLGALGTLIGLLLLRIPLRPLAPELRRIADSSHRWIGGPGTKRALHAVFLGALFLVTFWVSRPLTTPTWNGDDVRYVDAAFHNKKLAWHLTRYTHIYLVKATIWFEGGDAFAGSRTYWSFMAAVTVLSLAIGVRALGPGLQLRTLAITLFLLLSQWSLLRSIGAAYADYTAMMLVALAVAVYLYGLSRERLRKFEWPALLIGTLTALALRSKETGLILLWLPVLFLWSQGQVDRRRFLRRLGFWLVGALLGVVLLMSLDAWLLGDFWFSLRPGTFADFMQFKIDADAKQDWSRWVWPRVVWSGHPKDAPVSYAMRHLGVLAVLAALVAVAWRKRTELRLLHMMPLVYIVMLIGVHTPIFGTRYLYPILPVACLLGGAMFNYLGIESLSWKQVLSPRVFVPVFLAATAILMITVPYHTGELATGGRFVAGMSGVLAALLLVGAWLAIKRSQVSLIVLSICLLGYFAPSFEATRLSMARHLSLQRGELVLYPWRVFEAELISLRPRQIVVTPRLHHKYQMAGTWITGTRIARLFFERPHLRVSFNHDPPPNFKAAIGSRKDWLRWRQRGAKLEHRSIFDATGQIVLVGGGEKTRR